MSLLELCEPLFQYICRLSRIPKTGGGPDYAIVRSEVKALLQDIQQKAASDGRLSAQAKKLDLGLVFFVDSMISESELRVAPEWHRNRLAYEQFNELAGDEKFFDLLDETLKDTSPTATELLSVYYVCLGLGFTGVYVGQPEQLRKYMTQILPRVRDWVETDQTARICKEAYANVDTRDLAEPPSHKMVIIGILFLFFTLSAVATYYWMFKDASEDLRNSMDQIYKHDPASTSR